MGTRKVLTDHWWHAEHKSMQFINYVVGFQLILKILLSRIHFHHGMWQAFIVVRIHQPYLCMINTSDVQKNAMLTWLLKAFDWICTFISDLQKMNFSLIATFCPILYWTLWVWTPVIWLSNCHHLSVPSQDKTALYNSVWKKVIIQNLITFKMILYV